MYMYVISFSLETYDPDVAAIKLKKETKRFIQKIHGSLGISSRDIESICTWGK